MANDDKSSRAEPLKEESFAHWWMYVLALKNEKYYVGITSKTPEIRLQEHIAKKRGAYWTMKHTPLKIIQTEDLGYTTKEEAERLENKMTRYLMKKYGINNVRGGDLRDVTDYVARFGRIFDKEGWGDVVYISITLVVLILFTVDKYIVPILPGGIR